MLYSPRSWEPPAACVPGEDVVERFERICTRYSILFPAPSAIQRVPRSGPRLHEVTCVPELYRRKLLPGDLVILGSDGIFDVFHSTSVVDIVRRRDPGATYTCALKRRSFYVRRVVYVGKAIARVLP